MIETGESQPEPGGWAPGLGSQIAAMPGGRIGTGRQVVDGPGTQKATVPSSISVLVFSVQQSSSVMLASPSS